MKTELMKEQLFRKVMEAQCKLDYDVHLELRNGGFTLSVITHNSVLKKTASINIVNFEHFLRKDNQHEERELNFAINELTDAIKYGEIRNGYRIGMYQQMVPHATPTYTTRDIAEYFDLDPNLFEVKADETRNVG